MATGPLLVVGPEMGLETLVVVGPSILDMMVGFLITTCGETDRIILKKISGIGTSLKGQCRWIGAKETVEGMISSMIGKGMRECCHLLHHRHRQPIVADGHVM